jgi:hypothetical protein
MSIRRPATDFDLVANIIRRPPDGLSPCRRQAPERNPEFHRYCLDRWLLTGFGCVGGIH